MNTEHTMSHEMKITSEEQFLAEMIPHHQEAVVSSRTIYENTNNQELKKITAQIVSGQTLEISMLQDRLDVRYSGSTYKANYKKMMPSFVSVVGAMRDGMYMESMIQHHHGAIDMAQQALKLEIHPEVKEFAENVIKVQSEENKKFYELLQK